MEMTPVQSSCIAAVGHDPLSETLAVEFTSGGTYHYAGVSKAKFDELIAADSPGRHFLAHIKDQHEHRKL